MTSVAQRHSWQDAYDAQMAVWRWYRTRAGMQWCYLQIEIAGKGHERRTQEIILRGWDGEMGRLIDCDPIYVSEEMCEVVDAARATFAPEPLLETDLITPRGFLYFERPIDIVNKHGKPLPIHAASWAGVYSSDDEEKASEFMRRLHDDEAWKKGDRIRTSEMDELLAEGLATWAGVGITLYAEKERFFDVTYEHVDVTEKTRKLTSSVPIIPFHHTPWHFNMTFDGNGVDLKGEPSAADQWWTLLQSTFRLMQQRIAVKHQERLDRPRRRDAKRLGLPHEPQVVVVRLRREAGESGEPTGEEAHYSHRFIVGGHWRNQPYPSEGITRQIWISPYVKGPKDKPLIVKPRRVYTWDR